MNNGFWNQDLDQQVRSLRGQLRRMWLHIPTALGVGSILLPLLYAGFLVLVNVRPQTRVPDGADNFILIGLPIFGAAVDVAAVLWNRRTITAWLGLFLNIASGLVTVFLFTLAAGTPTDH